jgi:ribosomal protein S18 acetylase RimI-like enzyme
MEFPRLQIRRVCSAGEPAFEALVNIYTEAHVPSERKSREQLEAMVQRPGYFFLAVAESNLVVGFSIVRVFDDSDAALLEYIAVARERRSQGIGQRLLAEVANFDAFSSKFLLAEVDSDKSATVDQAERIRRKTFYRRVGWREVDQLRYLMPPVSDQMPPDMDMLVYQRDVPLSIKREHLKQWLERCYVDVYGMSADDARIEAMVHKLPEDVRLI